MKNNKINSTFVYLALTLVFIVLKLLNFIHWSWIWILSPIWFPYAVIYGIILFVAITLWIGLILKKAIEKAIENYKNKNCF